MKIFVHHLNVTRYHFLLLLKEPTEKDRNIKSLRKQFDTLDANLIIYIY